ncbi:MAG: phosphoglycerate dehydrogenase [Anaerolineales bacterium]
MKTILITAPYMQPEMERFLPVLEDHDLKVIQPEVKERLEEKELLQFAGTFDGTICGDDQYTEEVLEACSPRLKVISKWGTGIDSIDQEACACLGIVIGNTPNAFTLPVADTVLGYMLAFARNQPWLDRVMKGGKWQKVQGRSLSECVLGVIGVGNIGKAVLRRADAFGMRLLGNDIRKVELDFLAEHDVEMVALEELLSLADFISVNCDLNPSSYHLLNKETFTHVKAEAYLINTARGPIVEEDALIQALEDDTLAGAALDVFEKEPLPEQSPLREFDQVLLSPHNANSSPSAWERVHWNTIRNLFDGLGISTENIEGKG